MDLNSTPSFTFPVGQITTSPIPPIGAGYDPVAGSALSISGFDSVSVAGLASDQINQNYSDYTSI